jgi:MFS family permease
MIKRHHILYVCSMLMEMSLAGVTFSFPRRAAELGATGNVLGLLGAVWIGTYACAAFASATIAKRLSRGTMARGGCLLCVITSLGFAYTTTTWALVVLSMILGVGLAGFWPSVISWLGEDAPDSTTLNTRLAHFSISWNVGFLIGYGLIGYVFEHSPQTAFIGPAAVFAVIIVLLWFSQRIAAAQVTAKTIRQAVATGPAVPKGRGFRKNAWLANFAINFSTAGAVALFPQLAMALHINPDVHGTMLAVARCAALVVFIALQFLTFWRTRLWSLWIAQAIAAVALAWFVWARADWMFYVAFALAGAVSGYTYQASIYFTLEETVEEGQGGGLHEAVLGGGMASGSLLAGWVGQHYSLRSPYAFCAASLVVLIVVQMVVVFMRRRRKSDGFVGRDASEVSGR